MTGSEHSLVVYLGGHAIADLSLQEDDLHWQYRPEWQQQGFAVSPHLLLEGAIAPLNVQRFLRNLLPEGDGLDALLQSFRLSKHNTFGLIRALGADTPGALSMLASNAPGPKHNEFRPLSTKELTNRLDQRDHFGLVIWDGKPRLSVAGVQDKLNIVVLPDGQLGFGDGSLCSTHILKFEKQQQAHLVLNEYITMMLARACGLQVADVALLRFGAHPALLVKRFDRRMTDNQTVQRRHMIDGCQALNLPPEYKYERNFGSGRDVCHIREGASLPGLFAFTNACSNPALARQTLLDWALFNLLVFNHDAHGKNISFFIGKSGLEITPFYDLVNIAMYPDFEQDLAMALGDEFNSQTINAYQLADFAESCSLPRHLVATRTRRLASALLKALGTIMPPEPLSKSENRYLTRYYTLVNERARHLLAQAREARSISL
ncbi:HipA domain-containing protein [Oceanimonas baumannii]|uniref:HipA domain-containing protein n=1 Tax=Oceanimonas baumannii TaxID=129578 RepID=UPI001D187004|nr:HipA domain-containing protein [Oceanimonas baumannii]MCC4263475.1 HipA domain-containing protein [Oceanimonas baumannii]